MADEPTRPPIRIRFRFNLDTGDLEFIVDDSSPDRSEDYHDKVAHAIASFLGRHPEIQDAGHIRYQLDQEWHELTQTYERNSENAKSIARPVETRLWGARWPVPTKNWLSEVNRSACSGRSRATPGM